jgi:hypothetical protein
MVYEKDITGADIRENSIPTEEGASLNKDVPLGHDGAALTDSLYDVDDMLNELSKH